MKFLSFPGLGIGPFQINDTAFTLFGLDIKWYGIIITLGMILAYLYARTRAKYEGIDDDDLYDVTLLSIVCGIVGARLYYVVFRLGDFIAKDGSAWDNIKNTFLNIINIRNGGLAIYGGIILGIFAAFIFARIKKMHFPILLDVAAPAIMIGQIIGRWGNFVNVEAYGRVTTLPWRMCSDTIANELFSKGLINLEAASQIRDGLLGVHPTFFYESMWNLIGLALVMIFYKKKRYNGQVFLFYVSWYGLGRFFIEGLRTDSLYIGSTSLRISQLIGAAAFIVGVSLFFLLWKKTPEILKLAPVGDEAVTEESEEIAEDSAEDDSENTEEAESETEDGEAD